jgi:hypothetical protein
MGEAGGSMACRWTIGGRSMGVANPARLR